MVEKTLKSIEAITFTVKNSKFCIVCAKPATKLVHYQIEDAILVEKYCNDCAKNAESKSIQTKGWYV
jgi:hypothetical protein